MELKIHIISWTHGITEQLKAEYAFEWIGRMNNIQVCAMEIVNEESFIHITDKRLRIKALSLCVYKNNYVGLSNILYSERFKEGSQFFFGREPGQGAHR